MNAATILQIGKDQISVYPEQIWKTITETETTSKDDWIEITNNNKKYYVWIRNTTIDKIIRIAGITDTYDTAVPQDWLDQEENKSRWISGDKAIWIYKKGSIFGEPMWYKDIFQIFKKRICIEINRYEEEQQ